MEEERTDRDTERREPTGAPVVRGDPEIAGGRAESAIDFDPNDPASLADAEREVREFATSVESTSAFEMLSGAAACATLVRGESSYRSAADRAGEDVSVNFLRKWARVHDLPIAVRRYIALREIVPSAAQHVARVAGDARFLLSWAIIDHDLSVREVRSIASAVTDGEPIEDALERFDALPGETEVSLQTDVYHELRLTAAREKRDLDEVVAEAVEAWLDGGAGD
jgi:hypothetical protein